jgi:F0F1-type ATP synthase epsilon subunit
MADEVTQPEKSGAEQPPQAPTGKPTMAVKVYAPFKIYFEGEAYSVSAVNDVGPFDILPRHHNFLCMLVPCTLTIQTPEGQKAVKISRALMHVKANRVAVFVDV